MTATPSRPKLLSARALLLAVIVLGFVATLYFVHSCTSTAKKLVEQLPSGTTITKTTTVTSLLEDRYPRTSLIIAEDRINERFVENWKAEPAWWKIPFGDWPGEATVTVDAPARVIFSVPLEAEWTFRVQDGIVEVIAPEPVVEAVELQTQNIVATYNRTAARFDERQMEDKLRRELLGGMRQRADARIQTAAFRDIATKGIEKFVREFVLTRITDAPVKSVTVRFKEPRRQLQ